MPLLRSLGVFDDRGGAINMALLAELVQLDAGVAMNMTLPTELGMGQAGTTVVVPPSFAPVQSGPEPVGRSGTNAAPHGV
jgi:hypothetical protein